MRPSFLSISSPSRAMEHNTTMMNVTSALPALLVVNERMVVTVVVAAIVTLLAFIRIVLPRFLAVIVRQSEETYERAVITWIRSNDDRAMWRGKDVKR